MIEGTSALAGVQQVFQPFTSKLSQSRFDRPLFALFNEHLPILVFCEFCVILTLRLCRSRIPVLFPLLDSFPNIFSQVGTFPGSVPVSTSLSTDTQVALRIINLQQVVSRAISIDEREALSNSLGEIAEAYEEGWNSGSDEDED
jgi:hypothetical protein